MAPSLSSPRSQASLDASAWREPPFASVDADTHADAGVEKRLLAEVQSAGPLRVVSAQLAHWLVERSAWERLGFVRLSDYADERLGRSGRFVRDLARVGRVFEGLPGLRDALASGRLGWTRARLVARVATAPTLEGWIHFAASVSTAALARQVRRIDVGAVERGGLEDASPSRWIDIPCTPEVKARWVHARSVAGRVHGGRLTQSERAEIIAAEMLSALPLDADLVDPPAADAGGHTSELSLAGEPGQVFCASCGDGAKRKAGDCDGWRVADVAAEAPGAVPGKPTSRTSAGPGNDARLSEDARMLPDRRSSRAPQARGFGRRTGAVIRFSGRHGAYGDATGGSNSATPTLQPLPAKLAALLEGGESADAFELDRRLRAALSLEQRHDARTGALLASTLSRGVHRLRGFPTREGYVREMLGLDPSRARALLRIERAARTSPAFARAYRSGRLTALQAACLVPLVVAELAEMWVQRWVERARRFSLRRLREDVERALLLNDLDFDAWRRTGGLPEPDALGAAVNCEEGGRAGTDGRLEREIGAGARGVRRDPDSGPGDAGREIGAENRGAEGDVVSVAGDAHREIGARARAPTTGVRAELERCSVRLIVDAEVARLWRALLCSVRRRLEPIDGRVPTAGRALGVILDHVLDAWGARDGRVRRSQRVFERDGWRCVVPGCSSMRNLHDHHVVFRSAGGSDELANRVTLCAAHHLRGVHGGSVRCLGRAPAALRFELGVRRGRRALAVYASGDRLLGLGG